LISLPFNFCDGHRKTHATWRDKANREATITELKSTVAQQRKGLQAVTTHLEDAHGGRLRMPRTAYKDLCAFSAKPSNG